MVSNFSRNTNHLGNAQSQIGQEALSLLEVVTPGRMSILKLPQETWSWLVVVLQYVTDLPSCQVFCSLTYLVGWLSRWMDAGRWS